MWGVGLVVGPIRSAAPATSPVGGGGAGEEFVGGFAGGFGGAVGAGLGDGELVEAGFGGELGLGC